jgi:hypothetical protein
MEIRNGMEHERARGVSPHFHRAHVGIQVARRQDRALGEEKLGCDQSQEAQGGA